MAPATFYIKGPTGKEAYEQADKIAKMIEKYMDKKEAS